MFNILIETYNLYKKKKNTRKNTLSFDPNNHCVKDGP